MPLAPLPKYGRPPVTEVVCGVYFQSLDDLQVAHVGALWERLRRDFPRTETLPPLPPAVVANGLADFQIQFQFGPIEASPFPRVWFVSADDATLLQLQRDRLIINWRRRAEDSPYPSYDAIVARLRDVLGLLIGFLKEQSLRTPDLVGVELAYVNALQFGRDLDGPADIGSVVPFLAWPPPAGSLDRLALSGLSWNAQLDLADGEGNLHIGLNTTQRPSDGKGLVRLDLLARKFSPALETHAIWNWFDLAHASIVTTFSDITSRDVQNRVWERNT